MSEENPGNEDEYEILPHKEIKELKEELARLKEYEVTPTRKLQISILELNTKLDKLLNIFEEAMHEIKIEEGGLRFEEKMKPIIERMNKILEQNKDIAEGMVAIADLVKDIKEKGLRELKPELPPPPTLSELGRLQGVLPGAPGPRPIRPLGPRGPGRIPPPPPPKRTLV